MTPDLLKEEASRVLDVCVEELISAGKLQNGSIILLGCSTSEVSGARIGKASDPNFGLIIAQAFISVCKTRSMIPAFQCCEHLNRAVVLSRDVLERKGFREVWAIPQPKAGGSVPAAAWKMMEDPCLVLRVQADAGVDIGDTLIGMHLKPVAVPYRGEIRQVGNARVVCAFTRLPYIGGERAVYR